MKRERIVIIGAGIGGLTTGLLLSRLGFDVTVVDKNKTPGGLIRGFTRSGIYCPVGNHFFGGAAPGETLHTLWSALGVFDRIRLEAVHPGEPVCRMAFEDFVFDYPLGIEAFIETLRDRFPDHCGAVDEIDGILKPCARWIGSMENILSGPPGDIPFLMPLLEWMDKIGCPPPLKRILSMPGNLVGVDLEKIPLSLYMTTLASYLQSCFRPKTTGIMFADIFCDRIRASGGKVLTEAPVSEIRTRGRAVTGVTVHPRGPIEADAVISTVHPKATLAFLPEDCRPKRFQTRIENLKNTQSAFAVYALADSKAARPGKYPVFISEMDDTLFGKTRFFQTWETPDSKKHLVSVIEPDEPGNWRKWENTFTGHRGENYEKQKSLRAKKLLERVSQAGMDAGAARIIAAFTPLTVRDWVDSPGGSIYGVMHSFDQTLKIMLLQRPPIKGLYFSGQSLVAPGILGTGIGALTTVRQLVGPDRLEKLFDIG